MSDAAQMSYRFAQGVENLIMSLDHFYHFYAGLSAKKHLREDQ
jgi:hypothetical protein